MKELHLDRIVDPEARENFKKIREILREISLLRGNFEFFELDLSVNVPSYPFTGTIGHGLSFVPLDVLQTSLIGTGTLTWNYADFDRTNLNYTVTGALVVRAFIGRFEENSRT